MHHLGSFIFLGTGASTGVPVISCTCFVCLSVDPHNKRRRSSGLLKIRGKTILIDAGPDFREQALKYHIHHLDGALITHAHYDHIAGFDDLKVFSFQKKPLNCLLSDSAYIELKHRTSYLIDTSSSPGKTPYFHFQVLTPLDHHVQFCDLELSAVYYEQNHTVVTGYRTGNFAYLIDVKHYPSSLIEQLQGVETLVLSGLQMEPSSSHLSLDEAVELSRKIGAKMTWLSHVSHKLDHQKTNLLLPADVQLAYDGLEITILC
ncbi:MAG: MBL fold metallo-hydrolase [Candidatus Rhabdochlamydia sp.]